MIKKSLLLACSTRQHTTCHIVFNTEFTKGLKNDSEFTHRRFAKFIKLLLTQQLSKLCDLLRESGDIAVTSSTVGSVETETVCLHTFSSLHVFNSTVNRQCVIHSDLLLWHRLLLPVTQKTSCSSALYLRCWENILAPSECDSLSDQISDVSRGQMLIPGLNRAGDCLNGYDLLWLFAALSFTPHATNLECLIGEARCGCTQTETRSAHIISGIQTLSSDGIWIIFMDDNGMNTLWIKSGLQPGSRSLIRWPHVSFVCLQLKPVWCLLTAVSPAGKQSCKSELCGQD